MIKIYKCGNVPIAIEIGAKSVSNGKLVVELDGNLGDNIILHRFKKGSEEDESTEIYEINEKHAVLKDIVVGRYGIGFENACHLVRFSVFEKCGQICVAKSYENATEIAEKASDTLTEFVKLFKEQDDKIKRLSSLDF